MSRLFSAAANYVDLVQENRYSVNPRVSALADFFGTLLTGVLVLAVITTCMIGQRPIPDPIKLDVIEQDRPQEIDVDRFIKKNDVPKIVLKDMLVSQVQAQTATTQAMNWLEAEFGAPLQLTIPVTIFVVESTPQARTIFDNSGSLVSVVIASRNLHEGYDHYLVHELFHAFYQSAVMLRGESEVFEGPAAYAHFRNLYSGWSNKDIRTQLLEEVNLEHQKISTTVFPSIIVDSLESQRKYVRYALPYFNMTHEEVVHEIRRRYKN